MTATQRRIAAVLVLLLVVGAFYAAGGSHMLTFATLKAQRASWAALATANPLVTAAAYVALYIVVAALSLPGALVFTLAGGAIFGLVEGTVLVSFASAIGATAAMLASRYLFQETVRRRFGDKLASIDAGLSRDGATYLLTLRLIPIFPYFLINLLLGLTRQPARTFYWASQLGMLPATVLYVYVGTQIATVQRVSDIASPGLLGALALTGLLPLIAKRVLTSLAQRQLLKSWPRPKRFDRDLVVIGGGAAGLVTSYVASAAKAKVTLVENHLMGGDCLNFGCVPSKALLRSARMAKDLQRASALGFAAKPVETDFAAVMDRVQRVVRSVAPHDSVERYTSLGVDVVQGMARIVSPWEVDIDGRRLSTRAIVIAAGARPVVPPIPGIDTVRWYTSDTIWSLREKPARLIVLGGGPIGCELAQAFARLGCQTTLVEMGPRLLPREDADAAEAVSHAMAEDGVRVLTSSRAVRFDTVDGAQRLQVERNGGIEDIPFDAVLCAVGRIAHTEGYGLENLGIPLTPRKTIDTNEYLQTLYPNIYACGDVTGPYQLTHAAGHQAWYAAVNALFGDIKRFAVDYTALPWATFTDPEVARVGLSEDEARQRGIAYETVKYDLGDLDRALADEAARGFVKLLLVPGSDKLLGAVVVGEHAAEILAEFTLAMRNGLGLNKILRTVHTYPTWSEAAKYAAGEWKRAHLPKRALAFAARYHAWRRGDGAS